MTGPPPKNVLKVPTAPDEDRRLVDRCLAGDHAAWDDLYRHCQPIIISTAMAALGPRKDAREVSDEIAARVWLQLIGDRYGLLRKFDPERGCRLHTYVAKICRNQILNFRKAERRRRAWEVLVADSEHLERVGQQLPLHHARALPELFLTSLTVREREFCETFLLAAPDPNQRSEFTAANIRQLRCRVHRKLRRYLSLQSN